MKYKSILEMSAKEARKFLEKEESYFKLDLPDYFKLSNVLQRARKIMGNPNSKTYKNFDAVRDTSIKINERDDLNHIIYTHKDPQYTWRPQMIINPFLYIDLIDFITKKEDANSSIGNGWDFIKRRFKEFESDKVTCASIPLMSLDKKSDLSKTLLNWWEQFEQLAISKSIDFSHCLFTDIANFYPSIYTHSIPWALYGKDEVKNNRKKYDKSFGDLIDCKIRRLQQNQTNGIPQGSILMDLIAEIILGYLDYELINELNGKVDDYYIIRYRDDYRIFANNSNDIELISQQLQKVLLRFNLNLGSAKTFIAKNIITDTIKDDKLYWEPYRTFIKSSINCKDNNHKITLQKHLLEIHKLAKKHPNSGMIKKALKEYYYDRNKELSKPQKDYDVLISILVDIMFNNPNSISHCIIIISKLLENESKEIGEQIIRKIFKKYENRANTDYVEIWLLRLAIMVYDDLKKCGSLFKSKLHQNIFDNTIKVFPEDIINPKYKYSEPAIIDNKKYAKMKLKIMDTEIDVLNKEKYPF
jgi:hypothetical protein